MRKVNSKDFGARVRDRRQELGFSQEKLADQAGYTQSTIDYYEKGKVKRPDRCASALSRALRTTQEWLLWGEGPRTIGPQYLTTAEMVEKYEAASPERKAFISKALEDDGKKSRKSG